MTFEYRLPIRRSRTLPAFPMSEISESLGPPARLARMVALAHQLENKILSGEAKDYGALAHSAQVSPARIAQIVSLAQLAPEIQEYVLFLSTDHAGIISEHQLRDIAQEIRWDRQVVQFQQLVSAHR